MKRFPDWEARLAAQIEKARGSKFEWGVFDCALSACDAVAAMTGHDPGAIYRGKYKTQEEAVALIGSGGLGSFVAGIASTIGAKEVASGFGRRGDVVLVNNGDPSHALGFVDLSGRFALCASDQALERVPMRRWLRAWQIG